MAELASIEVSKMLDSSCENSECDLFRFRSYSFSLFSSMLGTSDTMSYLKRIWRIMLKNLNSSTSIIIVDGNVPPPV
jgi:hypothetical protein